MKKLILGISLMVTGFLGTALILMSTVMCPLNPWEYNNVQGWLAVILGMDLVIPLAVFVLLGITGLIIAFVDTFKKNSLK